MTNQVNASFTTMYEKMAHQAYQRLGSKLRNTVRTRDGVRGATVVFTKIGKGSAATKARHAQVPVMNVDHSQVECQLADYYAGAWVDRFDDLKAAQDEVQAMANAGAYAIGRKTDELIISELDGSTNFAGDGSDGLTKAKVLEAFEMMGAADVPDDGQRVAVIGWKQWSDLLQIQEFANADYIGKDELPWKATQAKRWLGTLWMPHSGLTIDGSSVRFCHWYHKTAVGHAAAGKVKADVTWHGDRAANFVSNMMSQGACLIDAEGVVTLRCLES